MAREYPLETNAQHRHHGPHRCGQDDDDRAHPLLHGRQLQDRRGPRGRRDHGLHGPGAGARHHDHVGRDQLLLDAAERPVRGRPPPHQHHRHARPRRLHDRGRALACACSTARSPCSTAATASSRRRETVWRQADKYNVPRIAFVNKMDKVGADFEMNVDSIRERLGVDPGRRSSGRVGEEDQHKGIVDLIKMKAAIFDEESKGQKYEWVEIPADLKAKCARAAREADRGLRRRRRRDHGEVPRRQRRRGHRRRDRTRALRKGTLQLQVRPRPLRLGVQEQGRAAAARRGRQLPPVAARHPAGRGHQPRQRQDKIVSARPSDDEPFAALAFKIMNDPLGNLTFFRVYSGTLTSGTMVLNSTRGKRERIGRILRMHANKREELNECQRRQHLRGRRPARHAHRRHALRREARRSSSRR